MHLDALFPVGGDHAIQNVVFVLEWGSLLTELDFVELRNLHQEKLNDSFPEMQTPQTITFNIQPGMPQVPMTPQVAPGVHFVRNKQTAMGTALVRTIQISPQNCVILINDYTRWDEIWSDVHKWMNMLVPHFLSGRPLTAVALQYSDAFEWRADPKEFTGSAIFSPVTKYLPPIFADRQGLWHCHQGFFEDVPAENDYKVLDNVNVNLTEDPGSLRRSVSIVTSHKLMFLEPKWGIEQALERIPALMAMLHDKNKEVLGDLLLQDVQNKIKLTS